MIDTAIGIIGLGIIAALVGIVGGGALAYFLSAARGQWVTGPLAYTSMAITALAFFLWALTR